jgi:hypothetical protein
VCGAIDARDEQTSLSIYRAYPISGNRRACDIQVWQHTTLALKACTQTYRVAYASRVGAISWFVHAVRGLPYRRPLTPVTSDPAHRAWAPGDMVFTRDAEQRGRQRLQTSWSGHAISETARGTSRGPWDASVPAASQTSQVPSPLNRTAPLKLRP